MNSFKVHKTDYKLSQESAEDIMGWTVYEVSRMRIKKRLAKDLSQSDKESEWEKGRESMFWKGSRSKVGKGKEKLEK